MPDGKFRDNMLTIKHVIPVTSVADPLSCTLPQAPVLEGAGHHFCEGELSYKQTKAFQVSVLISLIMEIKISIKKWFALWVFWQNNQTNYHFSHHTYLTSVSIKDSPNNLFKLFVIIHQCQAQFRRKYSSYLWISLSFALWFQLLKQLSKYVVSSILAHIFVSKLTSKHENREKIKSSLFIYSWFLWLFDNQDNR